MGKLSLLLVSDLGNGSADEDVLTAAFLQNDFRVFLSHPADCEQLEDQVDRIIIRNIWNATRYGMAEPWYHRWRSKPQLPVHDDLYVRDGDLSTGAGESKDYLIELCELGYPVIPSIDSILNLANLPETERYLIKPKDGFDAINVRKLTKSELIALNPQHYLIQPFVDFDYELSFYYLDKRLEYSLYAPNKGRRWDLVEFSPSASDREFAEKFVRWNPQKRGIERIDACRLKNGELLLVEISDQGGVYLSLPELPSNIREEFLANLVRSIHGMGNS